MVEAYSRSAHELAYHRLCHALHTISLDAVILRLFTIGVAFILSTCHINVWSKFGEVLLVTSLVSWFMNMVYLVGALALCGPCKGTENSREVVTVENPNQIMPELESDDVIFVQATPVRAMSRMVCVLTSNLV